MEMTYSGLEKRNHKRLRMNCTVIYRLNEPVSTRVMMAGKDVQAQMLDISSNGLSMVTDYDIPIDTILNMRFTLLKVNKELVNLSGPVEITGRVRSNVALQDSNHRLGIFFQRMRRINM